ncbi:NTE family protein [Chitinophaga skermanii]|uniref:NTE family protein n=1 Tax=Chitinophaga skermanii TaxID=331697 RepID=A0A327QW55_9BACT|nr:patatin-like phospholipase family protein [Chitinophaga skermanii]RAJ08896.1 NTE family protein [Chitinophaga skermanii]
MRKQLLLIILAFVFYQPMHAQQHHTRPKIGLTLSGGGAKGLAHIGILEAIDSAGLKIDYITGTSMGSIVGAMYAIGYRGDSIEQIARQMDWANLFSSQPLKTEISIEEKSEFGKYLIELPFEYGRPKLASGVIVGQQLWLELARLAYPVKDQKDFSKFSIPFKCVATDIATGNAVVLDSGELVTSIRASMAIPSVFTAVRIGNKKLVDGGVVRNFPTKTVKDMGADIIIGSNVSNGLRPENELVTPIDIIYQLGFYKDADDFTEARKLTNIYIHMPLKAYSAASFGSVEEIIEAGKEEGRQMYPVFKHLADSLKALDPTYQFVENRLPWAADLEITSIRITGLRHSNEKFFRSRLGLKEGGCYTPDQLRLAVQNVYSTRFYKQITYNLVHDGAGQNRMDITVDENPLTYVKFAFNYNTFTDFAAIVNITQRNFIVPNSRAYVTLAISENPRLTAEYFKYLGRKRNLGIALGIHYEDNPLTIYNDFRSQQEYKYMYGAADGHFQFMPSRNLSFSLGTRYEYVRAKPKISQHLELNGHVTQLNSYLQMNYNTTNRVMFPTKGMSFTVEAGQIFDQRADLTIRSGGTVISSDSVGLNYENYQRLLSRFTYYLPLNRKLTTIWNAGIGMNFNYSESIINNYWLGGITQNTRTQLPLVGYVDGEVISSSAATTQLALQYEVVNNLFLTPRVGVAVYDFTTNNQNTNYKFLSGYGMSVGYSSRFGPLEATLMYGDKSGIFKGYINIGFQF